MIALLELFVLVKGIISLFLVVFGCLKISRGISLAFTMLASISTKVIAFACNAKSFAIVIIFLFSFIPTANLDGLTKVAYQTFFIC